MCTRIQILTCAFDMRMKAFAAHTHAQNFVENLWKFSKFWKIMWKFFLKFLKILWKFFQYIVKFSKMWKKFSNFQNCMEHFWKCFWKYCRI
jgi:hypothetical protein